MIKITIDEISKYIAFGAATGTTIHIVLSLISATIYKAHKQIEYMI